MTGSLAPPVADAEDELIHLSAAEAGRLMLARRLSPVELVKAHLARIESVDDKIKSYLLVTAEAALKKAGIAEAEIMRGAWRGPLHGVPYGVKDNYFTRGVRTCANSRLLLDHVPDVDARAVQKLDAEGAILLGKLNTWEFGTGRGAVRHDTPFPHARNPWKDDHFTGGSSTGAGAAVAGGTAMLALGSDTGGSVRMPAAGCGVVGLKPTFGRISRAGILPNCYSLDVPGPLGRTVEDCALALQAIAGHDPADPGASHEPVPDFVRGLEGGLRGLTIGIVRDLGEARDMDAAVVAGIEDVALALREAGARIVEVTLPAPPSAYRQVTALVSGTERLSIHEKDFLERAGEMGLELRDSLMAGFCARAVDYVAALRRKRELTASMDALVNSLDGLLLPCAFHAAPPFSRPDLVQAFMTDSATTAFSVTGHPALSLCTGFDQDGMPTSAQIVGRYFEEAAVFRIARAYERARDWRRRRPPI
ncbi:MAG: amidase [Beijerinckiaceae bacterium]|jgi:aspartyl-tRNA(Asn)/glutamyl-tRNA(Gln) amidotransferase subunit A|nr:amidase [Beijerinckiaceae bacterium]